jgi:hypothetical protein
MFVPRLEPTGPTPPLVRRVEIAQAALDRFQGEPFVWGKNDCARLAAFVLTRAGYKPKLARFGSYSSARSARRALKSQGMTSMSDALDSIEGLLREPPLGALPGDLIAFPAGEEGWDALTVALGNGRVLGFHPDVPGAACSVLAIGLEHALAAWSVSPCLS